MNNVSSTHSKSRDALEKVLKITGELNKLNDIDTILDKILEEARKLARAEAGSIFLVEKNKLKFRYVQNELLYQKDSNNKDIYSDLTIPINTDSIVGYSAKTGKTLIIDDAYNLDDSHPFTFNSSFDKKSGFRTCSIMTVPLKTHQNRIVGVMQIINSKNPDGIIMPFNQEIQNYISFFASHASLAIERGIMTREIILRMMKMAELRDPNETGTHVQRVGAYTAEIYHRWALNKGKKIEEIKKRKDIIRLSAMLHDVGKVGIADAILKKPGRLNEQEYNIMKQHTIFGWQLFENATSELDMLSRDIALLHHEKWNGKGYPGSFHKENGLFHCMEKGKLGEEIPIEARICALADVFDALGSKRVYKEKWPDSKILKIIKEERGNHFDPDVVDAFFQILDVIKAIRKRYN
ncbi:MAG: HD domain-containing protein [Deltaproteobacteria bacterium]|jgi:HD-GYP domain-containing protein (c-di-GMP phosphodiesterase class II)|nr:HD domain-containing protein [Deltaproteobacteria bacterium]